MPSSRECSRAKVDFPSLGIRCGRGSHVYVLGTGGEVVEAAADLLYLALLSWHVSAVNSGRPD